METGLRFDYYYGIEAEQFAFYRVPRVLIKDERFKDLSSDAKLLYGLMLDRMSLSMKNGWLDEENRAYIHYTVENIMEDLGCATEKCTRILAELDSKKGIGLIEKKRQGLGKPDIIYVKNFASLMEEAEEISCFNDEKSVANTDDSTEGQKSKDQRFENRNSGNSETEIQEVRKSKFKKFENRISGDSETETQEVQEAKDQKFGNRNSRNSKIEIQEVRKSKHQKFENRNSGNSEIETQEIRFSNSNYNNISYTDMNYTNPINPINQSEPMDMDDGIDSHAFYMDIIRQNIEYDTLLQNPKWKDAERYEELYQLIYEVVCVKRQTIRIAGEDYPYELVKSKFLKLNSSHLLYVIESMNNTTTKISNIKAYMITALYNAPNTMNNYYQQAVQHDMYGGGWQEKGIV